MSNFTLTIIVSLLQRTISNLFYSKQSKMNVIFKTQSGQIQPARLSRIDLAEFKSVAQKLIGSIENVRFLVGGKQINTDDAAKFNEQKNLFKENCIIHMVQRMKGGYVPFHELLKQIHSAIPSTFKTNTNNGRAQCVACTETKSCLQFKCPSCNYVHTLCVDCAILYFTVNELTLKCFSCQKVVDYHRVFANSASFVKMLDDLQEMYDIVKNLDCQICLCGELQVNATFYSKQTCENCKRTFCFFCNNQWNDQYMKNDQYTCHYNCQYENAITFELVNLRGNDSVKVPNRRTCPKCRALGSYGDACQMHTCRLCAHQFCFICLRDQSVCMYNSDKKCTLAYQNYSIFPKSIG